MNFAYAQESVALLLLRLFCVEAFTISSLCHRLNYLTPFLIHTSAVPVWSLWLHCNLHTFTHTKEDMKISFQLILELDKFKTQPLTRTSSLNRSSAILKSPPLMLMNVFICGYLDVT